MRKFTIRGAKRAALAGGLVGAAGLTLLVVPAVANAAPGEAPVAEAPAVAGATLDDVAAPREEVIVTKDRDGNVTVQRRNPGDTIVVGPGAPGVPALPGNAVPAQPLGPGAVLHHDGGPDVVPALPTLPARPSTGSAG
ncbi:hypothetical protein [Nocardia huaxiensis]|uniref:Uncharacterized protein n=1 Tax=Nocardia huaxiensis TaxID=2755382 RepID=A0A7D6Z5N6_9NOCA|nr:hypothetical protein [Nocardia huaxiensis]QLY32064.1 hypothetical protein H0264_07170 [Nocardia huaxiensis]UFS95642.1 hypothetical protein LPY97_34050 [Nocardia huaxiensis]